MKSDYTMRIPFSFSKVSMTFSDIWKESSVTILLTNFSMTNVILPLFADEVDLRLGGGNAGQGTGLTVNVQILDYYMEPIDVDVEPSHLDNPNGVNELSIAIRMNPLRLNK